MEVVLLPAMCKFGVSAILECTCSGVLLKACGFITVPSGFTYEASVRPPP
jgi:hypothetical protein